MLKTKAASSDMFSAFTGHRPLKSLRYEMQKIWNPSWFQGSRATKKYFEGWYFKNISRDGLHGWSFIPGISLHEQDSHAFVQAINAGTGDTFYFRYPADEFLYSKKGFAVQVGDNHFSDQGFTLNLNDGTHRFSGGLSIQGKTSYPAGLRRPGIMGWYRYVPFMECYHGVVSLDHGLQGLIHYNDQPLDFNQGRGYIEKDWGSSMPRAWIWMQCNHFSQPGTSFMLSVARIPWIGRTFTGFLGFFHHQGKTISFATYTGARIKKIEHQGKEIIILIQAGRYLLSIKGLSQHSGALKAPRLGAMDRIIHESINAQISVTLSLKNGQMLFSGTGTNAGLELVGDIASLKP